ncbi:hypothetical protein [Lentzea sp.]|uniref:hypothetical protein n=1 Tax=Lentzea sp. TaxID=56099 RepID=UPI002CB7B3F7|nr:hypothetical protein [Lentzea sp.]HUQ60241.1 hypothetical protein [Lentzea sp.]
MTKNLEDLLNRMGRDLARSGEAQAAQDLLELRTAVAAATELMAAVERGDLTAAEFHAELLQRQVSEARPLRFEADE